MTAITYVPDEVLDKPLDDIINNGNLVHITGELLPTVTYAEVVAASIGNYVPVITKVDDGTGRKAVLAAKDSIIVDTVTNFGGVDKMFDQFVIVDTVNSKIKFIGVGANNLLSNTDKVNAPLSNIRNPAITLVV